MSWDLLFQVAGALAEDDHCHHHRRTPTPTPQWDSSWSPPALQPLKTLDEATARIFKLELMVEALVRVLQSRAALTTDELALMVQRIDLEDGVADGRIGPDRSMSAPKCSACGRPRNPFRDTCIFCGATPPPEPAPEPVPVRTIACSSCAGVVPEVETFFSESGVVCTPCYHKAGGV